MCKFPVVITKIQVLQSELFYVPSPPSHRERDTDKDGKLNFKEFFHGLFDLVRNYEEENHNSSHESDDSMDAPARKVFAELDKDNDGYITKSYFVI